MLAKNHGQIRDGQPVLQLQKTVGYNCRNSWK